MGRGASEELGSGAAGFPCFPSAAASLRIGRGDSCHLAVVAGDAFCSVAHRGAGPQSHPPCSDACGPAPTLEMLLRCPAALSALLLFCSHVRRFPSTALASLGSVMKVEGSNVRSS